MLTFKYKKETDKEYAHTEVYYNNNLLGYYIRNKSKFSRVGENWNFCNTSNNNPKIDCFYSKTRRELIEILETKLTTKN